MKTPEQYLSAAQSKIEGDYRRRTPKSKALHETARKFLPGGDTRTATYFAPHPLFARCGSGSHLIDVDGNDYLDFLCNYTALVHGHAHPKISKAIVAQVKKGTSFATPLELQCDLAQVLCRRVPSIEQVRFCNSGTEATMAALRGAKAFTGRNKILKMEGGYHGSHDAAEISLAPSVEDAGSNRSPNSVPQGKGIFRGIVVDVVVAPFNDIAATQEIIDRCQDDLAAVIIEPMMGAAGMIPAQPEYLQFLKTATQSCGALLIFDEIITLRIAHGGAQQNYAVQPDLTTFGKIIGGGLPVGAFGGRADVMALFDPRAPKISLSGTNNGNAVIMAAGLAALDLLNSKAIARINRLGEKLRQGLREAADLARVPVQVTGIGSLAGWHFATEEVTDYRSAAKASKKLLPLVHLALLNRGIFTAPRGFACISTPMRDAEVDAAIRAFGEVLVELQPLLVSSLDGSSQGNER